MLKIFAANQKLCLQGKNKTKHLSKQTKHSKSPQPITERLDFDFLKMSKSTICILHLLSAFFSSVFSVFSVNSEYCTCKEPFWLVQCSAQDVRSAWFNEGKMVAALFVSASLMKCRSTGKCLYRCSLSRFPKDPKLLWQNVLFCFVFLIKLSYFILLW